METVKYLRRRNLGNYEHEELEISAVVEDGQSRNGVIKELRDCVHGHLYGSPISEKQVELPLDKRVEASENKTAKKGGVKITKEKPQTKEVETKVEAPAEEKVEAPAETPAPTEEKKVEEKKVRKETTLKIKPSKATVYDRNLDTHKALLGTFLDKEFPKWRAADELKKAGKASRELNGKDFQDGEGNILEAFKEEFRKYMV